MSDRYDRRNRVSGAEECLVCCPQGGTIDAGEEQAVLADAAAEVCETRERRREEFSEPVCINVSQVYDSCRDRDCVADQRVYLTEEGQALLNRAINVKLKKAEVIWVFTDVEPLAFQRGYYSVDLKFFVCVTLEVFCGVSNPTIVRGLTTYDKRIILYGSEGNSKQFSSKFNPNENSEIAETWQKVNMPTVTVEVVEPVALTAKIAEEECCDCNCGCDCEQDCGCGYGYHKENIFPENICSCFGSDLVVDDCARQVLVTYGLFFIARLERDSQLLVNAIDYCIPTKECSSATEESPCSLFHDIRFPIDEFFPPQRKREKSDCDCGCK